MGEERKKKSPISCISKVWDLASSLCGSDRTSVWPEAKASVWSFETVVLCQTAPLLTWHLPLTLGTKPKGVKARNSFLKGKYLFFLFFFSPFTLVLQLYLPPLAEICLCLGQTVFPPLSLLYAAALLLDPQWQWRGTLVFNLFSHSQILCFQVINLCSPFYCMLHALGLLCACFR